MFPKHLFPTAHLPSLLVAFDSTSNGLDDAAWGNVLLWGLTLPPMPLVPRLAPPVRARHHRGGSVCVTVDPFGDQAPRIIPTRERPHHEPLLRQNPAVDAGRVRPHSKQFAYHVCLPLDAIEPAGKTRGELE